MGDKGILDFEEFLKNAVVLKPGFLLNCLKKRDTISRGSDPEVLVSGYVVRCTLDGIREDDFAQFIANLMVQYALLKKEWDCAEPTRIREIYQKARRRFVKKNPTGEFGEIILFALLESERDAPQVLNKMSLKTSGNVHVFGLDAIHLGVRDGEIRKYYGQSKTDADHRKGIKEAVRDLERFHSDSDRKSMELDLISNHIDIGRFSTSGDKILEIFDPYSGNKENIREVNAVFVGFDWNSITPIDISNMRKNIEQQIEAILGTSEEGIADLCHKTVRGSSLKNLTEFFFVPFTSTDKMRERFLEAIR